MPYAFTPYRSAATPTPPVNPATQRIETPTPTYWSPYYGGYPQLPAPTSSAAAAIQGNQANLPGAAALAGGVNAANTQQLQTMLEQLIPGYAGLISSRSNVIGQNVAGTLPADLAGPQGQVLTNITRQLSGQAPSDIAPIVAQDLGNIRSASAGQIPLDVINAMRQSGAEGAMGAGIAGSPAVGAAYRKALGLTSYGMQEQSFADLMRLLPVTAQGQEEAGLQSLLADLPLSSVGRSDTGLAQLGQMIAGTPKAPLMDPSSMFVSPAAQQATGETQAVYNAAPVPAYAQLNAANLFRQGAFQGGNIGRYSPPMPYGAMGGYSGMPYQGSAPPAAPSYAAAPAATQGIQPGASVVDWQGIMDEINALGADTSGSDVSTNLYGLPDYYGINDQSSLGSMGYDSSYYGPE